MSTPAGRLIAEEIRRRGPITFARFMELALYAPELGYYTRPMTGPGPDADYVTSPEIHPAFGGLLCGQLVEMWDAQDRPSPFWLVEGGPGTGRLAADIMGVAESLFPDFARALRLALIEASPMLRALQEARLARWRERIAWLDPLDRPREPDGGPSRNRGRRPEGRASVTDQGPPFRAAAVRNESWTSPPGVGCIFANELLDAFPVHRVTMTDEGLRELYVVVGDGRFQEVEGPLSRPEIEQQMSDGGGHLATGQVAEVNLAAPTWVQAVLPLITRGYVLLLDYGEPASTLYGNRHPRGTLRCYSRQTMNEEPFSRVGEQDITAHVDLSAVTRAAEAAGAELIGATSQGALLGRLGLSVLAEEAVRAGERRSQEWAHRSALQALADPDGLGRVTALLFGKDAPAEGLSGFCRSRPDRRLAEALAPLVLSGASRLPGAPVRSGSPSSPSSAAPPGRHAAGGTTPPRA